jgi:signal peptidase I
MDTSPLTPETSKKHGAQKKSMREFLISLAIIIGIVIPIRFFIVSPFIVNGASMDTTFTTNDYLIVDKVSYRIHNPERGDVVIFRFPNDPHFFFIKRIIGLPGETVSITGGTVSITPADDSDAFILNEPYITYPKYENASFTLGDDEYFAMGDNRYASSDSRTWGPLPEEFITGKTFMRLLPLRDFDFLPGEYRYNE